MPDELVKQTIAIEQAPFLNVSRLAGSGAASPNAEGGWHRHAVTGAVGVGTGAAPLLPKQAAGDGSGGALKGLGRRGGSPGPFITKSQEDVGETASKGPKSRLVWPGESAGAAPPGGRGAAGAEAGDSDALPCAD